MAAVNSDDDEHLDIFAAKMAKWSENNRQKIDYPGATAFIFWGDGKGNFRKQEFIKGMDFHEAKLGDLDGDGDIDILNKPYTWQTPRIDIFLQKGKN